MRLIQVTVSQGRHDADRPEFLTEFLVSVFDDKRLLIRGHGLQHVFLKPVFDFLAEKFLGDEKPLDVGFFGWSDFWLVFPENPVPELLRLQSY